MFEYAGRWWLFLWENHGSNLGSLSMYARLYYLLLLHITTFFTHFYVIYNSYYTDRDGSPVLAESWQPHARNPVIEDSYLRPAGRPVVSNEALDTGSATGTSKRGKDSNILYRFVMDNTRTYGERVYVMQIDKLTTSEFKETMLNPDGPPAKFLRYHSDM
jgi:hypothetical protein